MHFLLNREAGRYIANTQPRSCLLDQERQIGTLRFPHESRRHGAIDCGAHLTSQLVPIRPWGFEFPQPRDESITCLTNIITDSSARSLRHVLTIADAIAHPLRPRQSADWLVLCDMPDQQLRLQALLPLTSRQGKRHPGRYFVSRNASSILIRWAYSLTIASTLKCARPGEQLNNQGSRLRAAHFRAVLFFYSRPLAQRCLRPMDEA